MTVVQIRRALVVDDDFDFLTMQLISLKRCGFSDIVGAEVGQCRAIEFDALAAIDLGLPIERQMVGVFGDDDRRDQIFRWNATLDQMLGRRSLGHLALANAAGVFGPMRHDHLEARRDHVEPFRDILADFDAKAVAAGAALVGDIDDDVLARQVFRQRPTIDLALALNRGFGWLVLGLAFRLRRTRGDRLFDVLQHEGELTGIDLFRPRAEAIALKLLDDGDQTLVLGLRGDEQRLEGACVVGKSGGVGMASQNQDQSPESPAKYRFFHIISTSRDRRRRPRSNPSHPYPIQPLQQSRELRRREPHHSIAQRRPAERACSSRLIARTKPVPSQNNNFTRSLRLERKT